MNDIPLELPGPTKAKSRSHSEMTHIPVRPERRILDRGEDIRRILSVLRRRWLIFTVMFLFVLGGVALFTFRQARLYTATASLIVNSRLLNVAPKDKEIIPTASTEVGAVDTEIQILQSPAVSNRVVDDLRLDRRVEFRGLTQGLEHNDAIAAIGAYIRSKLEVARPGGTNVLSVTYTSPDPLLAARIANSVTKQYLAVKDSTRTDAAKLAGVGLTRELGTLRSALEQAEADVARYRAANNLLSSDGVTLTEQEISLYKQQDATARVTLAEEEARLRTARSQLAGGSTGDDVGEALNSQVVEQLRSQRSQVSSRLAELRARYRPQHPEVVKAQSQLQDIDEAIQAEISRVVSNLEARVQVARQRAGAVSGISSAARGQLASNNAATVRLNELERRSEALRSNYAAMLERQNALSTQSLVSDDDARLLSPALVPSQPSFPNTKLNLMLGILAGLLASGMTVWLLQLFDRGLLTSREVEEKLGIPHITNIAAIKSIARRDERGIEPVDFVVDRPSSLLAEAVRGLRLHLEKLGPEGGAQVVGLTSARPGEGKSTLAVMLARVSALAGRRTLLIDGDLRRPSIARVLELSPTIGLEEVLSGQNWIDDALILDEKSGAWILPSLVKPFTPAEIVGSEVMQVLLDEVRRRFDLIIIDAAPALAAVDARALLQHVDAVLMVVRWKYTHLPIIRAALKKLRPLGIEPAGIVLSQVNMKAIAAYGVDDVDYHYRSYENYGVEERRKRPARA